MTAAIAAAPREPPPSSVDKPKRQRKSSGKVARWTTEEEDLLRALVNELGAGGHWAAIAERLAAGGFQKRTGAGVDQHYQLMTGRRKKYGGVGGGTAADGAAAGATAVTAVEVAIADAEPAAVAAVIAAPSVEDADAAAAGGEVFAARVDVPRRLDGAAWRVNELARARERRGGLGGRVAGRAGGPGFGSGGAGQSVCASGGQSWHD